MIPNETSQLEQQLSLVWKSNTGFGYIAAFLPKDKTWKRVWVDLSHPVPFEKIQEWIKLRISEGRNIYYCPAILRASKDDTGRLFNGKENILGSHTLWVEIDGGDLPTQWAPLNEPGLIIESSPGKYHVYFILDQFVTEQREVEYYNRVAASAYGADKSGWDIGQLLRLAGTPNFKYEDKPVVKILSITDQVQPWVKPNLEPEEVAISDRPAFDGELPALFLELMETGVKLTFSGEDAYLEGKKFDRSKAFCSLGLTMYEAGFNEDQVAESLKTLNAVFKKWDTNVQARNAKREANKFYKLYGEKEEKRVKDSSLTFSGLTGNLEEKSKQKDDEAPQKFFTTGKEMGGWNKRRWILNDLIPLGYFTILAGRPKVGKTTLATTWAAQITNGTADGEFKGQKKAVLVVAMEEFWDDWGPRLHVAGADMDNILFWTFPKKPTFPRDAQGLLEHIINLREAGIDPGMMIIDPILSRMDDKLDTYKESDVRKALETIAELSKTANMTTLGIIHWNGSNSPTLALNIMGSKAVAGVSRATLHVIESPDSTDQQKVSLYGMDEGSYSHNTKCGAFTFDPVEIEANDGTTTTSRLQFLEDAEGSIGTNWRRALAKLSKEASGRTASGEKKFSRVDQAKSWILEFFERPEGKAGTIGAFLVKMGNIEEGFAKAQIYNALGQLENEGLIEKVAVEGKPGSPKLIRRVYPFAGLLGTLDENE